MTLRIGITIGLRTADEALWINGIKQNAVFLAEALRQCPQVSDVLLVNTTDVPIGAGLAWDVCRWPTQSFADAKDNLDVLIELGGQIDRWQTDHLKARGCKLVSYCCGSEYVSAIQSVLFNRPAWGVSLFVNQRYDDIWMIPQVANLSRGYFETLRRRPARVVPFVWNPVFLEDRTRHLPEAGCRQPVGQSPQRISIMEPNLDVVKFCLYPILIAEEAYRQASDRIARVQVTNAERFARESHDFIALMNQLDLVRQHKAVFLGRFDTPDFLSEHTDLLISHQWENPLNYFYLEACWQGFPLVHNASLCSNLGYYYAGNDVRAGAAQVLRALTLSDHELAAYRAEQRRRIQPFLSTDTQLVATYAQLLNRLVTGEGVE